MNALGSAPMSGVRLWYAVTGGIALWMVHISALAALVNLACHESAAVWAMHALTAVLGVATALAMWWSYSVARHADEADTPYGFLGRFGLFTGAISLLLIVWEGVYIPFISPCA